MHALTSIRATTSSHSSVRQEPQHTTLTSRGFAIWLKRAPAGDRLPYHIGYLALDRAPGSTGLSERDRRELVQVADLALARAQHGEIHLIQRRIAPCRFIYFAVKGSQAPGFPWQR